MNKIIIMGRLTRDPEIRQTQNGKIISSFSIAVDDSYGDKKSVSFIEVKSFGKTAETISKYFSKGKMILLEGKLKQETWEKDGKQYSKTLVFADGFTFLPEKKENQYQEPTQSANKAEAFDNGDNDDDDIPF